MKDNDETVFELYEAQVSLLCMHGDTPKCAEIRSQIIAVFLACVKVGGRSHCARADMNGERVSASRSRPRFWIGRSSS
jgi:hypothetical protein